MQSQPALSSTLPLPLPQGACDCHTHVFMPAQFPYATQRQYTPPAADTDALQAQRQRLGVTRTVLVQPSCYGTDNRALCAALEQLGPLAARGVAVINPATADDATLAALHQAGVRGLRLNFHVQGDDPDAALTQQCRLAEERLRPLGWHLQIHAGPALLSRLAPTLRTLRLPVVLDHFGGGPDCADLVTGLLALPHLWLKLSAPYRVSSTPANADLAGLTLRYLQAAPDRLVWGSDWPHTGGNGQRRQPTDTIEPFRQEDARQALANLSSWIRSDNAMTAILVDNPQQLYGF